MMNEVAMAFGWGNHPSQPKIEDAHMLVIAIVLRARVRLQFDSTLSAHTMYPRTVVVVVGTRPNAHKCCHVERIQVS